MEILFKFNTFQKIWMEIDSENNLLSRGLNERQFGPSDVFGVIYAIGQTNWKVEGAVECNELLFSWILSSHSILSIWFCHGNNFCFYVFFITPVRVGVCEKNATIIISFNEKQWHQRSSVLFDGKIIFACSKNRIYPIGIMYTKCYIYLKR